jgi:hypothetical protein
MFKVRRCRCVARGDCPTVSKALNVGRSEINHRFDRKDKSGLKLNISPQQLTRHKIRNLWILVHISPNSVPDKLADYREAFALDVALHRLGDGGPLDSGRRHCDRKRQRVSRDFDQVTNIVGRLPYNKRLGRIAAPSVEFHTEINTDNVAVTNGPFRRYPVNDFFVQRYANRSGKRAGPTAAWNALKKAFSAIGQTKPLSFGVQFFCCNACGDHVAQAVQHKANNTSCLPHTFDLIRAF